jgi:hypothetical protein
VQFFFPLIVIFGYAGCMWLLLILFSLLVVAALNVLVGAGVLLCAGQPAQPFISRHCHEASQHPD